MRWVPGTQVTSSLTTVTAGWSNNYERCCNPGDPLKELASVRKGGRWPLFEVGFQQPTAVVVYLRAHTGPLLRTERLSLARCPDIALNGGEAYREVVCGLAL